MGDSSDSDSSIEDITDNSTINNQKLPEKSKKVYERSYKNFMAWKASKKFTSFSEKVVFMYFEDLSSKFKSTTLWSAYSKLKLMLIMKHEVDIGKYACVTGLLRRKAEGYTRKKSKTFSADEINKFLMEAPNERYLATKVALVFGVIGACRRLELYDLKFSDVEVFGSTILVKIRNDNGITIRTFSVIGKNCDLCKKYMSLRPEDCGNVHFFLNYQSGKCTVQNFGINKYGGLPRAIAKYLELPNDHLYTGQCFRRTAGRIFVDAEGNIRDLRENRNYGLAEESNKNGRTEVAAENNKTEKTESKKAEKIESNNIEGNESTENYIDIKLEHMESIDNDKFEIETEHFVHNLLENTKQVANENLNTTEEDLFEFINVPGTSDSNLQNSTNHSKSETVAKDKDDSLNDSKKNEPQIRNQMFNTISNQTIESVNINIPNSVDLPNSFVPVHFSNCTIKNVNYYYNK